jgi:hypothetical protein
MITTVMSLSLWGCGYTLPPLAPAANEPTQIERRSPVAGTAVAGFAHSAPSPSLGAAQVVAFKSNAIILFTGETGSDGHKVPVSTLPLPLHVSVRSKASGRAEFMTIEGPRWIALADVIFSQPAAAGASAQP